MSKLPEVNLPTLPAGMRWHIEKADDDSRSAKVSLQYKRGWWRTIESDYSFLHGEYAKSPQGHVDRINSLAEEIWRKYQLKQEKERVLNEAIPYGAVGGAPKKSRRKRKDKTDV